MINKNRYDEKVLHNGKFSEKRVLQHTPFDFRQRAKQLREDSPQSQNLALLLRKGLFCQGRSSVQRQEIPLFQRRIYSQPKRTGRIFQPGSPTVDTHHS